MSMRLGYGMTPMKWF